MSTVFSEFEILQIGIKFNSAEKYANIECIGSFEEGLNSKIISKKCRGVVKKKVVRGDGTGTIKVSFHCPYEVYTQAYGMKLDNLIDGVVAYGQNSRHEAFSMTCNVKDEDGNQKLKAYPNCIIESGVSRKIENGAEEVAEIELEINIMPDDDGNGMYEALVEKLTDENVKNTWMTAFAPDLVKVASA